MWSSTDREQGSRDKVSVGFQLPNYPITNFTLHSASNEAKLSVEDQSIVILDFGSQYTQLIARRIRELKVFSAVLPCTASIPEIKSYRPAGIILSGGPCSVYDV